MMARGDLGDDAAVARVQVGLRRDDTGADVPGAVHERGGGIVAGGLEREDHPAIKRRAARRRSSPRAT